MAAALVSSRIAAGCCSVLVPPPDLLLVEGVVVVGLDSLVGEEGVVVVPEEFGVAALIGIFGGLEEPVNSGLTAGAPEAFGVGVAPGVLGVAAPGVVGARGVVVGVVAVGVTAAGVAATATVTGWGLGAPSLLSAA